MIIKCKMCGGDISFNQGETSGVCEYCGSTSTIPRVDDEQRLNRFNRANHYRRQGEFDKAIAAYERILEEDDSNAEAHWGAVLSRYGIEYVEDPATKRRVPTCHRVRVESILADEDYQAALKNAPDTVSRNLYEEQAKEIAEIQKGILAISAKEKPYDVFICYKESDEEGKRTRDSALAQEVYYGLTEQGYKVFFSRITLEDKLGQEYEPYIFAALNSARVMVVIGTKPEYFNAVWVKNEWSRYLHLMKEDRKRLLIPCYRDMDPYDLPEELSNLQSQDMSKIGFMQDLLRGIRKVLETEEKKEKPETVQTVVQQVVQEGNGNVNALLDRAFLALEDGEFDRADGFCEQALNLDARNSRAYLGKLMAERKVKTVDLLSSQGIPLEKSNNYQKSLRFASAEQKQNLEAWNRTILERNERQRKTSIRDDILARLRKAKTIQECLQLKNELHTIDGFEGVQAGIEACDRKLGEIKEEKYSQSVSWMEKHAWEAAIKTFKEITDYKDSKVLIEECEKGICEDSYQTAGHEEKKKNWGAAIEIYQKLGNYRDSQIKLKKCEQEKEKAVQETMKRRELERIIAEGRAKEAAARKKRIKIIEVTAVVIVIAIVLLVTKVLIPKGHYDQGKTYQANGEWDLAIQEFTAAGGYGDSAVQEKETEYLRAKAVYEDGDYATALKAYQKLTGYKDVDSLLQNDDNLIATREAKLAPFKTVGNVVKFGNYEQDNNTKNGKEEIEWIVLDVQNGKSLLLCKHLLDEKPYNTTISRVTWESCTLRSWLNGYFINVAFTAEEQSAILTTTVDNSNAQGYSDYSTNGGNNTQDKIFLLSYHEAFEQYFTNNGERMCAATDYAIAQGAYTSNSYGGWWLRSPGSYQGGAMQVAYGGYRHLNYVNRVSCIRPAFWIDLESDIF